MGRCTAAVDDVSGLGLRRRCIRRGCFGHCVWDGRAEVWIVDDGRVSGWGRQEGLRCQTVRWESFAVCFARSLNVQVGWISVWFEDVP